MHACMDGWMHVCMYRTVHILACMCVCTSTVLREATQLD